MSNKVNISVVGTGYVGLSMAVFLSRFNNVVAVDIDDDKVNKINNNESPIADLEIENYLKKQKLNLSAELSRNHNFKNSDFIIISTPTDYDPDRNYFDTSSVEMIIEKANKENQKATVVIKSTIPIGFTKRMQEKFPDLNIFFSPEFLREGSALHDNLYPSRIIVGSSSEEAKKFSLLLSQAALKKDIDVMYVNSSEAESIKLFSNTYLAMRVAFFNELDSFAYTNNLDTRSIIDGVSLDERIGSKYNNPSFGYGGYCLPKDTKQLLANFDGIPQRIIEAIVLSNEDRKEFLVNKIIESQPKCVGIYKLAMKKGSDNHRYSAVIGIIKKIQSTGIDLIIYDPSIKDPLFHDIKIENDFKIFSSYADIIVANRVYPELKEFSKKVFTRDLYESD